MKNKFKVHPSPSSPPSSSLSLLTHLLPNALITLATALTLSDQEVLAYMVTISIQQSNSNNNNNNNNNNKCKRLTKTNHHQQQQQQQQQHKVPVFSCDCFDCYTCYWVRWDTSPNRDLINKAIEAFEEHLMSKAEHPSRPTKSKRRDKMGRPPIEMKSDFEPIELLPGSDGAESEVGTSCPASPEHGPNVANMVGSAADASGAAVDEVEIGVGVPVSDRRSSGRRSWPEVLGSLQSRLLSLWGPNI